MKILFLHSGNRVPSSRFRVLPVARRLVRAGHRCTLAGSFPQKYDHFPWLGFRPSQLLKRLVRLGHLVRAWLGGYDVVVIDRELFDVSTAWWEDRVHRVAHSLVIEMDDAVFLRFPEKFEHLTQLADHLIVGNRFLEAYVRQYHDRVTVIPTCIEMDEYPGKRPMSVGYGTPVVGWIGTTANVGYLAVVAPALRELARRHAFTLRIIAPDAAPLATLDLAGVQLEFSLWRGPEEVHELLQFDVGLMPLPSDEAWTRYKCGLKLLQYMAVGIPAVASPIGVNADIVQHGVNGFLATTDQEWIQSLEQLLRDPELRQQIGVAARRTVQQSYSVEANLPLYLQAFEQARQSRATGARC